MTCPHCNAYTIESQLTHTYESDPGKIVRYYRGICETCGKSIGEAHYFYLGEIKILNEEEVSRPQLQPQQKKEKLIVYDTDSRTTMLAYGDKTECISDISSTKSIIKTLISFGLIDKEEVEFFSYTQPIVKILQEYCKLKGD